MGPGSFCKNSKSKVLCAMSRSLSGERSPGKDSSADVSPPVEGKVWEIGPGCKDSKSKVFNAMSPRGVCSISVSVSCSESGLEPGTHTDAELFRC